MQPMPELDAFLNGGVQRGDVPGLVAVATNESETIYEGAFGKRAIDQPQTMTTDSVFWIASMTKAATSTAAMQLVERGKLALDEPIGKHLPQLASRDILEDFDESGAPRLRPAREPITLRRLLTHTSGFGYDMWNADLARYARENDIPTVRSCQNKALSAPLASEPGSRWE